MSVGFSAMDPVDSGAGMMRLVKKVSKNVLFCYLLFSVSQMR